MKQSDKDSNTSHHTNAQTIRLDHNYNTVTMPELQHTIKSIKQKAPGESGITKLHLTRLSLNMTKDFLTLINAIISTGHISPIGKHAIMVFLPKPFKSPLTYVNYRHSSLLDVPGKILEK